MDLTTFNTTFNDSTTHSQNPPSSQRFHQDDSISAPKLAALSSASVTKSVKQIQGNIERMMNVAEPPLASHDPSALVDLWDDFTVPFGADGAFMYDFAQIFPPSDILAYQNNWNPHFQSDGCELKQPAHPMLEDHGMVAPQSYQADHRSYDETAADPLNDDSRVTGFFGQSSSTTVAFGTISQSDQIFNNIPSFCGAVTDSNRHPLPTYLVNDSSCLHGPPSTYSSPWAETTESTPSPGSTGNILDPRAASPWATESNFNSLDRYPATECAERDRKDELLLRYRREGRSYKEIQQLGGFEQSISTLRGRYRNLTKDKSARVRKPQWTPNDIRLLNQAVLHCHGQTKFRKSKYPSRIDALGISWKQVADWIVENGGSYHFGNATCKKKWMEVNGCPA